MKTIALVGAGEFTDAMNETDLYLYHQIKKLPAVVGIIATASGQETAFDGWLDRGIEHFKKLSIKAIPIRVRNKEDAMNEDYTKLVKQCGWIYFSGGDPSYLLSSIKNTLLWHTILSEYKHGCIISGASAGAMILGNLLLLNPMAAMRQLPAEFEPAFHLVDYMIIPHYDKIGDKFILLQEEIQRSLPLKESEKFLGIDEDTALIIQNTNGKAFGKGKCRIFIEGKKIVLQNGEMSKI